MMYVTVPADDKNMRQQKHKFIMILKKEGGNPLLVTFGPIFILKTNKRMKNSKHLSKFPSWMVPQMA